MTSLKKISAVIMFIMIVAGAVSADMSTVSLLGPSAVGVTDAPGAEDYLCADESLSSGNSISAEGDLALPFIEIPIEEDVDINAEQQDVKVLNDGSNSLNLCLSALISLGLCGSAQFVRKSSFGFVPDWYHSGSVRQVGNSYALMPDCSFSVQVYCFIQPEDAVTDELSLCKYRLGAIIPLWRNSQSNPSSQALRGPPSIS